jgi:hypothetical protein
MGEHDLRSLILACDFRVDQMWKRLNKHREPLASTGIRQSSECHVGRVVVGVMASAERV